MAGFDYAPIREVSRTLISDFGRNFVLQRQTSNQYDVATGKVNKAISEETFVGVRLDPKASHREAAGNVSGKMVRILAQMDDPPNEGDVVIIDQVHYNIVMVGNVQPACTPVLTEIIAEI